MGDHYPHSSSWQPSSKNDILQWQERHDLLAGPEQWQLDDIQRRLDDPVSRAEELNHILPDAHYLGGLKKIRLSRALQPVSDTTMNHSARRNPKIIADAIFPTLGPAIRKAISAILMSMLQSLNHILNQSSSFKGIKWSWINRLRQRSNHIPGIQSYNATQLHDEEMSRLVSSTIDLEGQSIFFNRGEYELPDSQEPFLAAATINIRNIISIGRAMGITIKLTIIGQTDNSGSQALNLELSRRRAQTVKSYLVHHEIDPVLIDALGTGAGIEAESTETPSLRKGFRSVIFKTHLNVE